MASSVLHDNQDAIIATRIIWLMQNKDYYYYSYRNSNIPCYRKIIIVLIENWTDLICHDANDGNMDFLTTLNKSSLQAKIQYPIRVSQILLSSNGDF